MSSNLNILSTSGSKELQLVPQNITTSGVLNFDTSVYVVLLPDRHTDISGDKKCIPL